MSLWNIFTSRIPIPIPIPIRVPTRTIPILIAHRSLMLMSTSSDSIIGNIRQSNASIGFSGWQLVSIGIIRIWTGAWTCGTSIIIVNNSLFLNHKSLLRMVITIITTPMGNIITMNLGWGSSTHMGRLMPGQHLGRYLSHLCQRLLQASLAWIGMTSRYQGLVIMVACSFRLPGHSSSGSVSGWTRISRMASTMTTFVVTMVVTASVTSMTSRRSTTIWRLLRSPLVYYHLMLHVWRSLNLVRIKPYWQVFSRTMS